MKKLFIILSLISKVYGQTNYEAVWKTIGFETGVVNYEVQQSTDTINWTSLTSVLPLKLPDSNNYNYVLPAVTNYYRVKANMLSGTFYTNPIFMTVSGTTAKLVISNATYTKKFFTDALSFDVTNDSLASYYAIQRSTDSGATFSQVAKLYPRGFTNYKATFFRWSGKPIYKVTPVLKNSSQGASITFQ